MPRTLDYPKVITRTAAEKRAREVFLAHCTPEQRQTWTRHGYIEIIGSLGGTYHLYNFSCRHFTPNVAIQSHRGLLVCVVLDGDDYYLPQYDRFLAQKTLLEVDEYHFRYHTPFPLGKQQSKAAV